MAAKNPIKYEGQKHTPFVPGDTLPPAVLNLGAAIQAGEGIALTVNPNGTITISNTCCEAVCVPNWQNAGLTRCTAANIEEYQEDGCGNDRWFDTGAPVVWTNNGAQQCGGGGTYLQPQINQCGTTRWFDTGVVCSEPCVPNWQNTGTTRCTGTNVENYQEDGCGNGRWFDTGVPVTWTNNGTTRCQANVLENQQSNQCGTLRWNPTGTPCDIPQIVDISSPPGEVDPGDQICWTVTSDLVVAGVYTWACPLA